MSRGCSRRRTCFRWSKPTPPGSGSSPLNPHLHFPPVRELERQLYMGAVALKLHPVHGDFSPSRGDLYPAVVFHGGTSNFAGASNGCVDPATIAPVVREFPELDIVLARGGRGWSYTAAACPR